MTKSHDAVLKQQQLIAGSGHLLSKQAEQFSFGTWPGFYKKAKGADIWDLDDKHYCDMSIGGIGATILGYADEDVDKAVINAVKNGVASSLLPEEEIVLAELLLVMNPWGNKVRFARTGGEAMAVAIRLVRAATQKDKILFCGYHGWHDWYLSANLNGDDCLTGHLLPNLSSAGVPEGLKNSSFPFPYNDLDALELLLKQHTGSVASIVMEPIRNIEPDQGYLEGVRKLADKYGVFLVFDEISSAFRMNSGPVHSLLGVNPDLAVFSKAMGNGYAISALVGIEEVMKAANNSFISSTCWTERIGLSAAIATINKHSKNSVGDHLMCVGTNVQKGWLKIAKKHNIEIEVGGIPPMSHFSIKADEKMEVIKAYYVQEMLKRGFLASNVFYAMGAHTLENVDLYLAATDDIWGDMKPLIETPGKLIKLLDGEPSLMGFKRMT